MKRTLAICLSSVMATVMVAGPAMAYDPPPWAPAHGRRDHDRRDHDRRHYRRDRDDRYRDDRGEYRHEHYRGRWHRGDHYRGREVVVRDYRDYDLRPPPRGYRWVRGDDGNFLLVAVASGIIADIILHTH